MSGAMISQSRSVPIEKDGIVLGKANIKIEVTLTLDHKVTDEVETEIVSAITQTVQKL
jgi:hypothetical protein